MYGIKRISNIVAEAQLTELLVHFLPRSNQSLCYIFTDGADAEVYLVEWYNYISLSLNKKIYTLSTIRIQRNVRTVGVFLDITRFTKDDFLYFYLECAFNSNETSDIGGARCSAARSL